MSMKETRLPAYNPAMPQDEKEKVIQESLRQIGQAMMATGTKAIAQRLLTKPIGISNVARFPGDLSISFEGTDGFTQMSVRIPFVLAGGATRVRASLWLDGVEIDRNASTKDEVTLFAASLPPGGKHTLQVQLSTDAGTATLFASDAWGAIWVLETLL